MAIVGLRILVSISRTFYKVCPITTIKNQDNGRSNIPPFLYFPFGALAILTAWTNNNDSTKWSEDIICQESNLPRSPYKAMFGVKLRVKRGIVSSTLCGKQNTYTY